ncbi:MAG: sigma-70 family RNA polymerase sigma factor [Lachnospiraceae bacterium]|nr:sigma-70 family RNA polymerase sigma factor [Lachnospiraceae bacterium]MEE1341493.1 sigma-70 family RNA polymerase sigma factor [Lachnospiraceae bacterium]
MQEKKIIHLFEERSELAIEETRKQYGGLIRSLLYRMLGNMEDTEECENDTYLGLWNSIPPTKPKNLKAYLLKIARNRALKRVEYLGASKRKEDNRIPFEELTEFIADNQNKIDDFTETDLAECLNEFIGNLNENNRKVFMLRYWHFLTVKEIMVECNMSKSRVESILYRVRGKLKKYLIEKNML